MNKTITIVITIVVVAAVAYILGRMGMNINFNNVSTTNNSTVPTAATNTISSVQSPSVSPNVSDEEILKNAIKAGLVKEHGQDAETMNITVTTIEGNFAKGMASAGAGGGIWFAAKKNGAWSLIWDGNGIIDCAVTEQYPDFPNTLIPQCYSSSSGLMVTR